MVEDLSSDQWVPFFGGAQVRRAIDRLGHADGITLVVGAGVSVDRGMPKWDHLVDRLLDVAGTRGFGAESEPVALSNNPDPRTGESPLEVFRKRIRAKYRDPLAAASVAKALLRHDFGRHLREELRIDALSKVNEASVPTSAWALGKVCRAFLEAGKPCVVITTNFDDTLEQALAIEFEKSPYLQNQKVVSRVSYDESEDHDLNVVDIYHLHGLMTARQTLGELIFAESEYYAPQGQSWQDKVMHRHLAGVHPCLFVGSSMTDLNVLRSLMADRRSPDHCYALLRRDRQPELERDEVRDLSDDEKSFEVAVSARWREVLNTTPLLFDHSAQRTQFLCEVALRRSRLGHGLPYEFYSQRLSDWYRKLSRDRLCLVPPTAQGNEARRFQASQAFFQQRLSAISDLVIREFLTGEAAPCADEDEVCVVHCWVRCTNHLDMADDGDAELDLSSLGMLLCSDRVWTSTRGVDVRRIVSKSRRLGVEVFATGRWDEYDTKTTAFQWNHIHAVPVFLGDRDQGEELFEDRGRLPVGAVTVASNLPVERTDGGSTSCISKLARDPERMDHLHRLLAGVAATWLDPEPLLSRPSLGDDLIRTTVEAEAVALRKFDARMKKKYGEVRDP